MSVVSFGVRFWGQYWGQHERLWVMDLREINSPLAAAFGV